MKIKKKIIGGKEYVVVGSTTDMERGRVVFQSYTVRGGKKVTVENGRVNHSDGTTTDLNGNAI